MGSKQCCRPFSCFSILEFPLSDFQPFIFSCAKYSIGQLSFFQLSHSIHGEVFPHPEHLHLAVVIVVCLHDLIQHLKKLLLYYSLNYSFDFQLVLNFGIKLFDSFCLHLLEILVCCYQKSFDFCFSSAELQKELCQRQLHCWSNSRSKYYSDYCQQFHRH